MISGRATLAETIYVEMGRVATMASPQAILITFTADQDSYVPGFYPVMQLTL